MEVLKTEVSQMRDVMQKDPKAVMGDREFIALTPEQMMEMCQNIYQLVEYIGQVMSETDAMVSSKELMLNEELKNRAMHLVDEMNSCVKYLEGVWSGQQN